MNQRLSQFEQLKLVGDEFARFLPELASVIDAARPSRKGLDRIECPAASARDISLRSAKVSAN